MRFALGLFLIFLGFFVVLGYFSLGSLPNFIDNFSATWPLILVFIGISLLSGIKGLKWLKYVNALLILGYLFFLLLWPAPINFAYQSGAQDLLTKETLSENTVVELNIDSSICTVNIERLEGTIAGNSVGNVVYEISTGSEFYIHERDHDDTIQYNIGTEHSWPQRGKNRLNIKLLPGVLYRIILKGGVLKGGLDLSGIMVDSMTINAGVMDFDISLSDVYPISLKTEGGVGKFNVFLPQNAKAQVEINSGIKKITVRGYKETTGSAGEKIIGSISAKLKSFLEFDAGVLWLSFSD
ncbi:hypothetical protein AT15_08625 [Kosmotoga arenicorallina S304]|uniref:DUF5668 domain-containing protein n=1 Tax=Kosmotoga arenicorallina S304 TaxID=1453497 RepID=A0A176K200_9BACT|nr:hypothetical protein [Kosmotoga arenicorallina]OAA31029.1 hypothetical protein AT15_08625 [Kosmotoga arenicorallina S304]